MVVFFFFFNSLIVRANANHVQNFSKLINIVLKVNLVIKIVEEK